MRLKEREDATSFLEASFPDTWESLPVKYLTRRETRKSHEEGTLLSLYRDYGVIPKDSRDDNHNRAGKDLSAYLLVSPGDLVINKMKAWQGSIAVSPYEGIVSPAYFVYSVDRNVHGRFLHYQLRSMPFIHEYRRFSSGVRPNQWDLDPEDFGRIEAHLPSVGIQKAIANFLDRKTAAIDALIEKKEKLLELLAEKRSALINQAVTKGLDPNVPMKDSGIPWIGKIPEHWESKKVKRLTRILRGKFSHRPRNDPRFYGGSYPFLQTGEVARAKRTVEDYSQTLNEKGFSVSKEFPAGTLLMVITGAKTGHTAILGFDACFPDSVVGFVPKKNVNRDYLYEVFQAMQSELLRVAIVSTQENLNVERIGDLNMPCPPLLEQKKIADCIRKVSDIQDEVTARLESQKAKLQEYRQSLITAAVTGRLEIPAEDFEASHPEEKRP